MAKGLIVIGSGGHARVVIDTLQALGRKPLGIVDPNLTKGGEGPFGLPVLGGDEVILDFAGDQVELVMGLGSMPNKSLRRDLHQRFTKQGYRFLTLVHPTAYVAQDVDLAEGVQVMAGAILQTGTRVCEDVIINTGAQLDHDCRIGAHVHIAPGVVLSGDVRIGDRSHIGTGAKLIQGLNIGTDTLIGAGAVVTKDVSDTEVIFPARTTSRDRV